MNVTVSGVQGVLRALDVLKDLPRTELNKRSKAALERVRAATPVDTGAARDAWHLRKDGNTVQIVNDKDYIAELNAGSSRQAPRYFVEKAILEDPVVRPSGSIVKYS